MSVSLAKGAKISLDKNGSPLTQATMGLGWDVRKSKGFLGFGKTEGADIDLDASAIMFGANGKVRDIIYFGQLNSHDGSIRHTGDNLTGAGDGDDEQIKVDLTRIDDDIQTIVFTVNSFRGDTFDRIENAFCRLLDERDVEFARYDLSNSGPHTAQIMAKITRKGNGWEMTAIGEPADGRTAHDLGQVAARFA